MIAGEKNRNRKRYKSCKKKLLLFQMSNVSVSPLRVSRSIYLTFHTELTKIKAQAALEGNVCQTQPARHNLQINISQFFFFIIFFFYLRKTQNPA